LSYINKNFLFAMTLKEQHGKHQPQATQHQPRSVVRRKLQLQQRVSLARMASIYCAAGRNSI
jgi:hypothetical protein